MKFAFIAAKEVAFPVVAMCRVLGVSRSGYYASANRPPSAHAKADGQLAVEIAAAHRRSRRRYGSPRVHRALRKKGIRVGKKRVERVMREKGIVARQKRRFRRTTDSKHASPIAPNVLARDFEPKAPNQAWAGDVTYIATDEGWAYLAVLLDLYSRRVVGWAMSTTNDTELALAALHRAVATRHVLPAGVVHHTDRGSPYASEDYRRALAVHAMTPSMSRTGDCWDNAVVESFFSTLKNELVYRTTFVDHAAARAALLQYIEGFYNRRRLHSALGYLSPVEYEKRQAALN